MKYIIILLLSTAFGTTSHSQIKRVALSPLQVLEQSIADTDITITYSRPAMRGRAIFGDLVPYNEKWRTGANRNTKITFSQSVMIGDSLVKAGDYALITAPGKTEWEVYFYKDVSSWEVPKPWDKDLVAAKLIVPSKTLASSVQSMTLSVDDVTYESCNISLRWEHTQISIPIQLQTEEQMIRIIDKTLSGPSASDFYLAALYREGTSVDLDQALEWIDKAIEMRDPDKYWDYLLKTKILLKMKRYEEAKKIAQVGLEIAQNMEHSYGMRLMEEIIETTNKF